MKLWGLKKSIAAVFGLWVFLLCGAGAAAEENKPGEVIKVAFPDARGFSFIDENGKRSGITYDFLVEISKYTGWTYEFIDGPAEDLLKKLRTGEADLMGGMLYVESMKEQYIYSEYNMGSSHTLLIASKENESIKPYDLLTLNGKRIGVFSGAGDKIKRLEKYLDFNGISCEIIYFDDITEYENSLDTKKADILLGSDINIKDSYNVVGRFDSGYCYFALSNSKEYLLDELNEALKSIYEANPDFINELYTRYFPDSYTNTIYMNKKEKEYIKNAGPLRIAMIKERYPLNYKYNGEMTGVTGDIFSLITKKTGISFEFVYADSYQEMLQLVSAKEADIAGYFLDDNDIASDYGLITTRPYMNMSEVIIKNKKSDYPKDGLTMVAPEGKAIQSYVNPGKIIYAATYEECIRMINSGRADFTCIPLSFAEDIFIRENISNITVLSVNDAKCHISFALRKDMPTQLYSIMSKVISNLSDQEKDRIIKDNQLSIRNENFSLQVLINTHPGAVILISVLFVALVAAIIIIYLRGRMKSELMLGELRQAEATSEAKSEFLSRMSHDLRTPMNAIIGLTRLIKLTGETTPSIDEKIEKIDISSRYLLSLLNDILDMSKLDSQKMSLHVAPFKMQKIITQLRYMMYMQAEEKAISFECYCDVEDSVFIGDTLRIRQVLMNLLSNAMKFTKEDGKVLLKVKQKERKEDRAVIFFSVRDNGVGIRQEHFGKIFEAFEQINENEKNTQGTGLGLSISASLVQLMGGELKVKSELGAGTEFYFELELPISKSPRKVEEQYTGECVKNNQKEETFCGMRLLLAEDNQLNAEIVIALLEKRGIILEYAKDGGEAAALFQSRPPYYYDAVLMDIQMPVMNGLRATETIRKLDREDAGRIPIIAMTANTFKEDKEQAFAAGMNDFVPKPFEIEELCWILKKYKKNKSIKETD